MRFFDDNDESRVARKGLEMLTSRKSCVAAMLAFASALVFSCREEPKPIEKPAKRRKATDDAPVFVGNPRPSPTAIPTPLGPRPSEVSLNLRASHPNGSALRVTRVVFRSDRTGVTMSATNGTGNAIKLNNAGDDLILRDDLGNRYDIITPTENPEMEIAPRGNLNGTFYFKGSIHRNARLLTLTTNERLGSMRDFASNPKMKVAGITIPR